MALAALAVPRLRLTPELAFDANTGTPILLQGSSAIANDPLQKAIAEARRNRLREAPLEQDLEPRLEAELVVAKRRIEELQAQLGVQSGATKLGSGAQPSPIGLVALLQPWLPWLFGALGLGVLIAAALLMRRRRAAAAAAFELAARDLPNGPPIRASATTQAASPAPPPSPAAALEQLVDNTPTELEQPLTASPSANAASTSELRLVEADAQLTTIAPEAAPVASTRASYQAPSSDVDVQELSQVTEEAEVYVELGRIDQAIALLKSHVDAHHGARPSPAPWLMLIDLYRRTGNRAAYDELAPRFQQRFNGRLPSWENYGQELALDDGLEAFPHLIARISRDWGTQRARELLDELLYDNRGGSRLGFSLAAYRDILLLVQIHDLIANQLGGLRPAEDLAAANPDDGTPKWTLDLETVESGLDSPVKDWLNRQRPQ
ncbi:MAG: hypothetical protein NZ533_08270 [Casimicrobiaceae bacterium]|nr:hypothetical protein [Casimicrobiaceae bacterium]MCX8099323.1 hypothetical protein [Casimicrobiaceae bacterium]MDW8312330.1 hypothetical protein [Burkholderiales bacterium]